MYGKRHARSRKTHRRIDEETDTRIPGGLAGNPLFMACSLARTFGAGIGAGIGAWAHIYNFFVTWTAHQLIIILIMIVIMIHACNAMHTEYKVLQT